MASTEKVINTKGEVVYKVRASGGRGKRVTRNWKPEPGWSSKTIQRELNKFAAHLEGSLKCGETLTRQETLERDRAARLEAAQIKTLQQYVDGVFMPAKNVTFSENARSSYESYFRLHILPTLGDIPLEDITPAMINHLILDFQQTHAHASTVKLYNILNGVFGMAFLDETIQINPMARVSRPKPRKDEAPQDESEKAYTIEQLRYILKCVEGEPLKWQVFIYLLADTGMRRGECGALQWADIDFKAGTVTIRRNVQYTVAAGVYITTPKTGKIRTVDIGPDTLGLLRQLQQEQAASCISKWIFTQNQTPEIMHPQTPTRYFQKFSKKYGVADFHPHKLRHTSASAAIVNGADVASVAARLGHSDTSTTLRLYSHANEESVRRAGQIVRDALKEAKEE